MTSRIYGTFEGVDYVMYGGRVLTVDFRTEHELSKGEKTRLRCAARQQFKQPGVSRIYFRFNGKAGYTERAFWRPSHDASK